MKTKTPYEIFTQADRLFYMISDKYFDGEKYINRDECAKKLNKIDKIYMRYIDNIYSHHTNDRKGLSVEESNHIWFNAKTPASIYTKK